MCRSSGSSACLLRLPTVACRWSPRLSPTWEFELFPILCHQGQWGVCFYPSYPPQNAILASPSLACFLHWSWICRHLNCSWVPVKFTLLTTDLTLRRSFHHWIDTDQGTRFVICNGAWNNVSIFICSFAIQRWWQWNESVKDWGPESEAGRRMGQIVERF